MRLRYDSNLQARNRTHTMHCPLANRPETGARAHGRFRQ